MTSRPRSFTSDNNSGACREVLAAVAAANPGHVPAHGSDDVPVPAPDGKLTPELVESQAWGFDDVERARPAVVSLTESTEMGTVYSPAEIRTLADQSHSHGMRLHVDGARLANAAASLGVSLAEITSRAGANGVARAVSSL